MPFLQACLYGLLWQKRFHIQQSIRQSSGVLLSESTDSTGSPSSLGQTAVLKLAFGGGWAGRRRTGAPPHPSRRVRRQDARGSKTRRSVPVWQLLLPLLICIVFAAGRTGQKAARDTLTHIPLGGGKKALVESITVWVLQLGALQSLLSDTQKLLAELLQGEAISLMPCCHANDGILQTKWRKLTWRWPQKVKKKIKFDIHLK